MQSWIHSSLSLESSLGELVAHDAAGFLALAAHADAAPAAEHRLQAALFGRVQQALAVAGAESGMALAAVHGVAFGIRHGAEAQLPEMLLFQLLADAALLVKVLHPGLEGFRSAQEGVAAVQVGNPFRQLRGVQVAVGSAEVELHLQLGPLVNKCLQLLGENQLLFAPAGMHQHHVGFAGAQPPTTAAGTSSG